MSADNIPDVRVSLIDKDNAPVNSSDDEQDLSLRDVVTVVWYLTSYIFRDIMPESLTLDLLSLIFISCYHWSIWKT